MVRSATGVCAYGHGDGCSARPSPLFSGYILTCRGATTVVSGTAMVSSVCDISCDISPPAEAALHDKDGNGMHVSTNSAGSMPAVSVVDSAVSAGK